MAILTPRIQSYRRYKETNEVRLWLWLRWNIAIAPSMNDITVKATEIGKESPSLECLMTSQNLRSIHIGQVIHECLFKRWTVRQSSTWKDFSFSSKVLVKFLFYSTPTHSGPSFLPKEMERDYGKRTDRGNTKETVFRRLEERVIGPPSLNFLP